MRGYINSKANVQPDRGGVFACNMRQSPAGTVPDLSGNGNNGTLNGGVRAGRGSIGDFLEFDGVDGAMDTSGISSLAATPKIINIWFKSGSSTASSRYLFSSDSPLFIVAFSGVPTGKIGFFDGTWRTGPDSPNDNLWHLLSIYSDGVDTSQMYLDKEHVMIDTPHTPVNIGATSSFGSNFSGTSAFFEGGMLAPNILEVPGLTQAQVETLIAEQYALGKTALFKTNPVNNTISTVVGSAAGPYIGDSPFRAGSGSFDIVDDVIDGKNVKVIECITAGVCYVPASLFGQTPQESAYGGFEFDYYRPDANGLSVWIISDEKALGSDNGYFVTFGSDGVVQLRRRTAGATAAVIMASDTGVAPGDVWRNYGQKRKYAGEFYTYLDKALLDVSGGSGTNPATDNTHQSSSYLFFSPSVGVKISLDGIQKRLIP